MPETPVFQRPAAFLLRLGHLQDLLTDQLQEALAAHGLTLKGHTTGIVNLLHHEGPCSIATLSDSLGISHQLTSQRLNALKAEDLITLEPDPDDGRRKRVRLTQSGIEQGQALQAFLDQLDDAYLDVFTELGADLDALIVKTQTRLKRQSLADRIKSSSETSS